MDSATILENKKIEIKTNNKKIFLNDPLDNMSQHIFSNVFLLVCLPQWFDECVTLIKCRAQPFIDPLDMTTQACVPPKHISCSFQPLNDSTPVKNLHFYICYMLLHRRSTEETLLSVCNLCVAISFQFKITFPFFLWN